MNSNLSEYIFLHYQTDEYYRRYLKQEKRRRDGRQLSQHRNIKINIQENTVILNLGETTIISSLTYKIQPIIYSPLTNKYSQELIKINVQPFNGSGTPNKYQRNASKAIEQFITDYMLNNQSNAIMKDINKQLVFEVQCQNGSKELRGIILNFNVLVAGNDGGLAQYGLLATELLAWTACIKIPGQYSKQKSIQNFKGMLDLDHFIFPIRYCQILDEILIDPTSSQCKDSNFQITIMKDLLQKQSPHIHIQNSHKGDSPSLYITTLQKLYDTQMSKLTFNIKEIKQRIRKGEKNQNISIKNI